MRRWSLAEWPGPGLVQSISVDMQSCSAAELQGAHSAADHCTPDQQSDQSPGQQPLHSPVAIPPEPHFTIFGFLAAKAAQ